MTLQNNYTLNLDIKKTMANQLPIYRQGDTGLLRFRIFDDGILFDLATFTRAELVIRLPNNDSFLGVANLNNGFIEYQITGLEIANVGDHSAVLTVYSLGSTVSVRPFKISVYDNLRTDTITELSLLQNITAELTTLGEQAGNEIQRENREVIRESNEAIRISNEEQRVSNEIIREQNNANLVNVLSSFDFIGEYSSSTNYVRYNTITYNGSSYIALRNVSNVIPSDDGLNWQLLARRGIDAIAPVNSINGILPGENGALTFPVGVLSDEAPSDTSQIWLQNGLNNTVTIRKYDSGEWLELNPRTTVEQIFEEGTNIPLTEIHQNIMNSITASSDALRTSISEITLSIENYPRLPNETNDNGRIARAFTDLAERGGTILFPMSYEVTATMNLTLTSDVNVNIVGGPNSMINAQNLTNVLYVNSTSNLANVSISGINIDAISVSPQFDTNNRMQGISILNARSAKVEDCKITNLYGTGIFFLNNRSVVARNNTLLNVRGYNQSMDNYGDGIYVAQNTSIVNIENNIITNPVSSSLRCGRIGITLEFNVSNAIVKGNYISGYNRGIHSELTMGGHKITGNTILACFIGFVSITERGSATTIVENNNFSNLGFALPSGVPLLFYQQFILIGSSENNANPKLKFVNNIVNIFANDGITNSIGLVYSVSINRDYVEFSGNNVFVDPTVSGKNVFSGSRNSVWFNDNVLTNVGVLTLWFQTLAQFNRNEVTCESFQVDRSQIEMNDNIIRPQTNTLTLGTIIANRPEGSFNRNSIFDYGPASIDNTSYATNDFQFEISENTFTRTKSTTPILPLKITTGNIEACDVFHSNKPNNIVDQLAPVNNRTIRFYNSIQYMFGRRVMYASSPPANRQWTVGDMVYNVNPTVGQPVGWECTVSGNPGTWVPFAILGQVRAANKADSVATTIESLRIDFNDLLLRMRNANLF